MLPLITDEVVTGIVGLFVSGLMGLIAFTIAYLSRIRRLESFGIRRARFRHIAAGAGLGVAAYLLGLVVATAYISLTGDSQNIQSSYQAAAAGGSLSFALTLIAKSSSSAEW